MNVVALYSLYFSQSSNISKRTFAFSKSKPTTSRRNSIRNNKEPKNCNTVALKRKFRFDARITFKGGQDQKCDLILKKNYSKTNPIYHLSVHTKRNEQLRTSDWFDSFKRFFKRTEMPSKLLLIKCKVMVSTARRATCGLKILETFFRTLGKTERNSV